MANTYSQIYIQAVFAVDHRASLIQEEWREKSCSSTSAEYSAIKDQKLIAIGGVEDHIHLLFGLRPNIAISDLIRDVKSDSTVFVNRNDSRADASIGKKASEHSLTRGHSSTRLENMF